MEESRSRLIHKFFCFFRVIVKNQNYHTDCMLHPRGWTGINPDMHTNWPMLHPTLHPDANWLVGLRHAWALVNMLVCVVEYHKQMRSNSGVVVMACVHMRSLVVRNRGRFLFFK